MYRAANHISNSLRLSAPHGDHHNALCLQDPHDSHSICLPWNLIRAFKEPRIGRNGRIGQIYAMRPPYKFSTWLIKTNMSVWTDAQKLQINTAETAEEPLGSAEPGIVMVSADDNGNGIADDTWYVLAGENFDQAVFTTVTYSDNSAAADNTLFVAWTDNHGNSGYIIRNVAFHNHSFFPSWKADKQLSFSGFRLPDNGFFDKKSRVFRQHVLWGYADSWPNNSTRGDLSLYNARTLDNKPADVTKIDFIRIYTGVLQNNGALGETSTEISAIEALH